MGIIAINQDNFDEEVLSSEQPILVDFWAPWCGPCRMVGPIVEDLAADYDGRVKVGKVNVDEEEELARKYGVMSIPTLIVFQGGREVQKAIGARSKADLAKMIDAAL